MEQLDHSSGATVARLADVLALAHQALTRGIKAADDIHAEHRWSVRADPHMYSHIVRREAMELLKALDPEADDDDDLGAAMSGLRLTINETDQLRIWHGAQGQIRVPSTEVGRAFLDQPRCTDLVLPGFGDVAVPPVCNTVLMWDGSDGELTRFTLLRPIDVRAGRVVTDWEEPLLVRMSERMSDVSYRRRKGAAGEETRSS